ncbi:hypothetical protein IMZ48_26905 [Candidatus Bathyarchaeota archaeon]|nr:hypothetical protein [Candidatus Bathyarchaeota archaeon]
MEAPNRLTKVIEKEKNHCLRDITHMINFSPLLNDRIQIVSISPRSSPSAPSRRRRDPSCTSSSRETSI